MEPQAGGAPGSWQRIPASVWVVAALAAALHMAPYWRAQLQTPPGWTFTGNLKPAADFVQRRVWFRQAQRSGVFVANTLTSEPNRPHLPVPLYWLAGKLAEWTGVQPETVHSYLGAPLAFALTLLLFLTARHFMSGPYQTWCVFLLILVGGGFGAHLKILKELLVPGHPISEAACPRVEPPWRLLDSYGGTYAFNTLFDTHLLLIWLMTLGSVLALYAILRRFSYAHCLLTACLYALTTFVHVHEGVLLIVITASVALLCWRKGLIARGAVLTFAACSTAAALCLGALALVHRSSGLPAPLIWMADIRLSVLLIAYPLAWVPIAWGLSEYWSRARLEQCFLLGWALGCTALTLSGPFYPTPARGLMTLQVPIYLIAGAIYFAHYARLTVIAAAAVVAVSVAGPSWVLSKYWLHSRFEANAPYKYISGEHRDMVDLLRHRATESDVLLADVHDVLWLAPEYPGRHYCAHFFLTVGYQRKRALQTRFFKSTAEQQAEFLRREGIRVAIVLLAGAGFITYLALDAVRHVK
jgi:hypothetical protein